MQPDSSQNSAGTPQHSEGGKPPRSILEEIFAFPPNRETLGGTAYFLVEPEGNILIDCPAWEESNQQFLQDWGGVRWLFITHRGGMSKVSEIQSALGCGVVTQEREAYLLPEATVTTFEREFSLSYNCLAIWTPGYSPGSSCLYYQSHGGVLFSGRHLLPSQQGEPTPIRMGKTFHWFRQLGSLQALRDRFSPETLRYICPGASTGFLRGRGVIDQAYQRLSRLDLEALRRETALS
ncbi:MAG: MBL fold metallo-hydrolase [Cyanobacteria bacterium QS_9_48_30]|nr:MAG: MBL fold metallo-hydrolase [Cyanobacteria bacterium QS_9_48_30]